MFKELIQKVEIKYPLIGAATALIFSLGFQDPDVLNIFKDNTVEEAPKKAEQTNYLFLHYNERSEQFEPVLKYEDIIQKNNFTFYGNLLTFVVMHDEPATLSVSIDKSDYIIHEKIKPYKKRYQKYSKEITLDSALTIQANKTINSLYIPYVVPYLSPSNKYRLTIKYKDSRGTSKTYKALLTQQRFY
jgi:hypothetical protein